MTRASKLSEQKLLWKESDPGSCPTFHPPTGSIGCDLFPVINLRYIVATRRRIGGKKMIWARVQPSPSIGLEISLSKEQTVPTCVLQMTYLDVTQHNFVSARNEDPPKWLRGGALPITPNGLVRSL